MLEKQISGKLQSDEPIDVEYWEQLLHNVSVYKSRAELTAVYKTVIDSRLRDLRQEQQADAFSTRNKLALLLTHSHDNHSPVNTPQHSRQIDPEPSLKIRAEDKAREVIDEQEFLDRNVS